MKIRDIQARLQTLGFYHGVVDGVYGLTTEEAIVAFKRSKGLNPRPYIGPITLELLFEGASGKHVKDPVRLDVPWVNELGRYLGLHEKRDWKKLSTWLRSDGHTLGDPRELPWCGDAIHTAIRLTLRHEKFLGRVGRNPYLARNWLDFGMKSDLKFGVIVVLWRGKRNGNSGHVCVAIGYDPANKRIRVRGGNQQNTISDTWVDEARVLGYRKPATYRKLLPPIPTMDSSGRIVSTNEA